MQIDWNPIRLEYVSSHKSMEELAKQFDVNASNLKQRASDENWVRDREVFRQKTRQEATEKAQKKAVESLVQKNERRSRIWRNIAVMTTKRLNADVKTMEIFDNKELSPEDRLKALKSLLDTKEFKDLAEVFKIACMGERLEDGQPTTISKNDNTNRDFTLTDVLKNLENKYGNPNARATTTAPDQQPPSKLLQSESGVSKDSKQAGADSTSKL